MGDDELITESQGHFDEAEYQRQLEHGVDGMRNAPFTPERRSPLKPRHRSRNRGRYESDPPRLLGSSPLRRLGHGPVEASFA